MSEEFVIHNQFKESLSRYRQHDPHLKKIKGLPLVYHSPLLEEPKLRNPGIYLITGGRQVGKTTFLKQFILGLLEKRKVNPENILFLSGELIDTHHVLRRIIEEFYNTKGSFQYLFIDEINYIPDWDKSIKYLADCGVFERMSVILTGSDSRIIQTAMKRFAGRRGMSAKVDFNFFPLSFKEFICLKNRSLRGFCDRVIKTPLTEEIADYERMHKKLNVYFFEYLLHGGYLPAITDYELNKTISQGIVNTYIQWIIGDILKCNKSENYLFEILRGIKETYNTQVSWNSLGKRLSIEHHKTVADYCYLLESAHVLHIQEALLEHKLIGAPKKNRKIYFRDSFIDHSITNYLGSKMSFINIEKCMAKNEFAAPFVEAVVVNHCKRWAPTYYIKGANGEVDVALVQDKKIYPIEVKWTKQIRPVDIKQIQHYKEGIILTSDSKKRVLGNNHIIPLIRFLIHVSAGQLNL
ncbi:MAG: ATP-binding protein [Candidatus Omnitrophica bacterium]|nr:ATP-binding protein [Candidatus Omnitrophota bacterium]